MLKESWPGTRLPPHLAFKSGVLISSLIGRWGNVGGGPRRRQMGEELSPALRGLLFCVLLNLPPWVYFWLDHCSVVSLENPSERPPSVLRKNVDWIFSLRCVLFSNNQTAFKIKAGLYEI